ncbi:hypothetical protein OTU49_013487, partial [Cherax quadricarinatus]
MELFLLKRVKLLTLIIIMVRSASSLTGNDDNAEMNEPQDADASWLQTPPYPHIQPVLSSSSKKMARMTTDDEGNGESRPAVVRSVDDEETISQDEREADGDTLSLTLKKMALDRALSIQGRASSSKDDVLHCDEFINSDEFFIHSPGYPNNYPANTTCQYQIYRRQPDYCGVIFTVLRLDLATRPPPLADTTQVLQVGGAVGMAGVSQCPG